MKINKLLKLLLCGVSLMKMSVVGDEGGGADPVVIAPVISVPPVADAPKGPTDAEAKLLKEVMQKKEALTKTATELAVAQAALKAFEGIDVESVRKLLADQKAAETAGLEAKGEWDRLKARMVEDHTSQNKALNDQIATLQAQLNQSTGTINELSIGTKFGQSSFISTEMTMTPAKARIVFGDHFDLEAGKIVGYDKPRGSATRTAIIDQYGNAVDFDAAMRKIVEADTDRDSLIRSKVRPGAGSETKAATGKQTPSLPTDSLSKIGAGLKGLKLT